jgi:hypothetical protein
MYTGFFIIRPTMILLSEDEWALCGEDEVSFSLDINAELVSDVEVDIEGLDGAVISDAGVISSPAEVNLTISNLSSLASGTYNATLVLNTQIGTQYELPITIAISQGAPTQATLTSPAEDAAINEGESITFTWSAVDNVTTYLFELATDMGFTNIVESEVVNTNSFTLPSTLPLGSYHWRVKASNDCGDGPFSQMAHFEVIFVGVGENDRLNMLVYPNPATDNLFIQSSGKLGHLEVFDAAGRKVLVAEAGARSTYTLNVSALEKGNYTVRSESGFQTGFVVIR